MTTNITYKFIGDATSLNKATKTASSNLDKMGSKLKSSFSASSLLGPVAAAASFNAIADAVTQATKAYFEDAKSLGTLNGLIDNNTNATSSQKKALDATIQEMSLMSAVADDDLRNAMSKLVVATGDVTKAQDLLQLSLDVSAGTGKDLGSVSAALSKAYNGNYGALAKLVPGVEKGAGAFDDLKSSFSGAAATAGANNPFGQMNVVIDQLNEKLGEQFAPLIKDFMAWLSGPEGTAVIQDLSDTFEGLGLVLGDISDFLDSDMGKMVKQFGDLVAAATPLGQLGAFFQFRKDVEDSNGAVARIFGEYVTSVEDRKLSLQRSVNVIPEIEKDFNKKVAPIAQRIKDAAGKIRDAGEQFKKSINFSDYLDEKSGVFDTTKFINKFRGIVAAAKELPTKLKALRKAGASPEVLQQVIAMGPEQGLAVANGFLSNAGSAKEYSAGLNTLSMLGQKSAAQAGTSNTYQINVNKANMTAEEIITAIQKYERKTGKKVVF